MTTGTQYFSRLQEPLLAIIQVIAQRRYGTVPDFEDRQADLQFRLAEALSSWQPQPGYDTVGYFLRYCLGQVLGWGSHDAVAAADERTIAFTDLAPETMEWLEDSVSLRAHQQGTEEALWRIEVNDEVMYLTTPQVVERYVNAIDAHDDFSTDRKVAMLKWLADRETIDMPRPRKLPVTPGDLGTSEIITKRTGYVVKRVTIDLQQATEAAARGPVPWVREQYGTPYDLRGERMDYSVDFDLLKLKEVKQLVWELRALLTKEVLEVLYSDDSTVAAAVQAVEQLQSGDHQLDRDLYRQAPSLSAAITGCKPNNRITSALRYLFGVPSELFNSYNPSPPEIDIDALTKRIMVWAHKVAHTKTHTGSRLVSSIWPVQLQSVEMALHGASLWSIKRAEKNYWLLRKTSAAEKETR